MPANTDVDLSIIIVAWNVRDLVDECLTHIKLSTDKLNKEVLFVDNGSKDDTVKLIKEKYPDVILIESPTNLGFIRANNLAFKQAKGKYILMLNSDAFVGKSSLQETFDFMERTPDCGVCGARLINRDGTLQASARTFPTPLKILLMKFGLNGKIPFVGPLDDMDEDHDKVRECDWVVGCYLMVKKSIVDKMDFFLRTDFFLYNDDNDLCLRVKRLGWKVYFYPTDVVHIGGGTTKVNYINTKTGAQVEKFQLESQFIYFRKNYHIGISLLNFLFIILADLLFLLRKIISPKKEYSYLDCLKHVVLTSSIFFKTRFGSKSIN